jgi:hypothetical protein
LFGYANRDDRGGGEDRARRHKRNAKMQLADADEVFLARVPCYEERIRSELLYVRDYRFGRNVAARANGFDWTVIGVFDSSADHDRYQVSALHQEMKEIMSAHIADIAVCNFDSVGGR